MSNVFFQKKIKSVYRAILRRCCFCSVFLLRHKAAASLATLVQARAGMALNLADNSISSVGISVLMTGLAASMMTGGSLRELNLSDNAFGDKGLEHVSEAMSKEVPIERLVLARCKLSNAGAASLAPVLRGNKSTAQLVLAGNGISRKGWLELANGLADNKALLGLDIGALEAGKVDVRAG